MTKQDDTSDGKQPDFFDRNVRPFADIILGLSGSKLKRASAEGFLAAAQKLARRLPARVKKFWLAALEVEERVHASNSKRFAQSGSQGLGRHPTPLANYAFFQAPAH